MVIVNEQLLTKYNAKVCPANVHIKRLVCGGVSMGNVCVSGTAPKNSTSGATSSNNGTYSSHNFTFVILMIVLTVLKICVWCPR